MEDLVRDAFASAEPSERTMQGARGRAVAAASSAASASRRWGGRRRVLTVAAVAALVLGAGAATASMMLTQRTPAVPSDPGSRAAIGESGVLAHAPWLFQAGGSPPVQTAPRLPSLRFPPGTTYGQALDQLVRSVIADGTLPGDARIAPALPPGAVWARGGRRSGPRLDLTAPAGFARPTGRILTPDFQVPGWVTPSEAAAIGKALADGTPVGEEAALLVMVIPPALAPCQSLPRASPCRLDPPPSRRPAAS